MAEKTIELHTTSYLDKNTKSLDFTYVDLLAVTYCFVYTFILDSYF